ncbi:hypothetical protein [Bacteriovorax sp. Seq25_V]|uniref:hypothetical protein n=1 Tax=Bacteriovorax sp. Seq25_V TaxID=1201288 RepID=UPI00038A2564|nr:hypothetical protein [Bacteriovorax sp. Seq25_V]EQC46875.1 hypothetical protein M900_2540 [Bacteriovorax sp. Seq25_V]
MKKLFKASIMSLMITLVPLQSSHAAIGAFTALFNPVVGGKIALAGLASVGAGTLGSLFYMGSCDSGECLGPLFLGVSIGLVILDEGTGKIEFNTIDPSKAQELGLKKFEVLIFNSEIEEANAILSEVISMVNETTTTEEASQIWEEYESSLSPETFNVMKALVAQK